MGSITLWRGTGGGADFAPDIWYIWSLNLTFDIWSLKLAQLMYKYYLIIEYFQIIGLVHFIFIFDIIFFTFDIGHVM